MSLPCGKIDEEVGNLSSEDNTSSTEQCAYQTTHINVSETRPTHDFISTIENSELSMAKTFLDGAVGVVAFVLVIAAALIIISMISFLSGDFCVDHDEVYDSAGIYEMANALIIGSHMFGLIGAVVGLVLLVIWNPPFTTTTQHLVDNRVQPMSGCVSVSFIIDGILLCAMGGILSESEAGNDNLPTWVWFTPYFLVGACMFAMIIMLHIRNLVAPNTFSCKQQKCNVMATQVILVCHLFLSFFFGTISASFYKERYCIKRCMKLFSPYCTSLSGDE